MTPLGLCQQWATLLAAHDVRAGTDPRNVTPPCVLFTPPAAVRFDLGCGGTADIRALLLVPGPGQQDAWQALEVLLPRVVDVLPVMPDELRTTTYQIDDSGPMPAYELTYTAAVDWS